MLEAHFAMIWRSYIPKSYIFGRACPGVICLKKGRPRAALSDCLLFRPKLSEGESALVHVALLAKTAPVGSLLAEVEEALVNLLRQRVRVGGS